MVNSASTELQIGISFDLKTIRKFWDQILKAEISYFQISNISATKNQEWHEINKDDIKHAILSIWGLNTYFKVGLE